MNTIGSFQWHSQNLEVGAEGVWEMEVPQQGPGAEPLVVVRGTKPPYGCQTKHNFVYLAKVHEPLLKHEKNLRCSVRLFTELSSN